MTANVAYMKRVLIIHGWDNERPDGHWHRMWATASRIDEHLVTAKTDLVVA
jgi:predicted alpha/beta hydrolase family esterase